MSVLGYDIVERGLRSDKRKMIVLVLRLCKGRHASACMARVGEDLKASRAILRVVVFCSSRVVNNWNSIVSLPEDVIDAPSISFFKSRLDNCS